MINGHLVAAPAICPIEAFRQQELVRIELRIARRADELARSFGSSREKDVTHWLQAEHEMWDAWS